MQNDEIQPRRIHFPTGGPGDLPEPKELQWLVPEPDEVTVTYLEAANLWIIQRLKATRNTIRMIKAAMKAAEILYTINLWREQMSLIELLKQRRFWAFLLAGILAILKIFGVNSAIDPEIASQQIVNVVEAIIVAITGILAFLSYLFPKKQ